MKKMPPDRRRFVDDRLPKHTRPITRRSEMSDLSSAKGPQATLIRSLTAHKAASMERARREDLADLDPSSDAASALALTGGSMLRTLRGPVPP